MSHRCPVNGCPVHDLPDRLLMDIGHWRMVPNDLQRAVYRAYQGGRGVGSPELLAAQLAAVSAVNDLLRLKATGGQARPEPPGRAPEGPTGHRSDPKEGLGDHA